MKKLISLPESIAALFLMVQLKTVFHFNLLSISTFLLILCCFIARVLVYRKINFKKSFFIALLLFYYEVSLGFSPLLELVFRREQTSLSLVTESYAYSLVVLILAFLSDYLSKGRGVERYCELGNLNLARMHLFSFSVFISSLVMIYLCFRLKVGVMGIPAPILPYKLEPILNLARTVVFPMLYTFAFFAYFKEGEGFKAILLLACFLVYATLEMFARGSRGVIFFSLLPILMILIRSFSMKKIMVSIFIILCLSLSGFVGGNFLRNCHHGECQFTQINPSSVYKLYIRIFGDLHIYSNILAEARENKSLGTFDYFMKKKGALKINTHAIDKVPLEQVHSSGITAFNDGFLLNSNVGPFFTLVLLFVLALGVEKVLSKDERLEYCFPLIGVYLFNRVFLGEGFWSFYIFRSVFTLGVFPITLILLFFLQSFIYKTKNISNNRK